MGASFDPDKPARPPRTRPRPMAFDPFFLFVYTLIALAFLAQCFLIVWPLIW